MRAPHARQDRPAVASAMTSVSTPFSDATTCGENQNVVNRYVQLARPEPTLATTVPLGQKSRWRLRSEDFSSEALVEQPPDAKHLVRGRNAVGRQRLRCSPQRSS